MYNLLPSLRYVAFCITPDDFATERQSSRANSVCTLSRLLLTRSLQKMMAFHFSKNKTFLQPGAIFSVAALFIYFLAFLRFRIL